MEGSVPHTSELRWCADPAGSVPLGQISNHTAATNLITIQQALLQAMPGRAGGLASLLDSDTLRQDPYGGRSHSTPPRGYAQ